MFATKVKKEMEHNVDMWNIPSGAVDSDEIANQQQDRDLFQPSESTHKFTDFTLATLCVTTAGNHESKAPSNWKHADHKTTS